MAKQIADALEAAQSRASFTAISSPRIKVRADGTVKVLDFGSPRYCARGDRRDGGRELADTHVAGDDK